MPNGVTTINARAFEYVIIPQGFSLYSSSIANIETRAFARTELPVGFNIGEMAGANLGGVHYDSFGHFTTLEEGYKVEQY